MEGFVAETIGSKMHWNEDFGSKILEGAHRLLRIEVIFPEFRSVVGPDGQESNVRLKFFPNLLESFKVPGVSGVVNGSASHIDDITAIPSVMIRDLAGSPVFGRNKGDGSGGETKALPPLHFVNLFETDPVNEITNSIRNDNGLIRGDPP